tara:strand:- start:2670 stop:3311 length:642 start_codon:yes stop_codon:yes gene_type:complete
MTYAELKSSIQNYLQNSETTFVNDLPTIIKQAEGRILNMVRLPVFRKAVQGNLTDGNPYLETPSDFLDTFDITVISSNSHTNLLRTDVTFIREAYPNPTVKGTPKHYSLFDENTFIVGPTPDADYTSELHYFYRPASITAGTDSGTTWLSTNATNALLYGSIVEAYTYMKGEPDLMNLYNDRYDKALARLKVLAEGRNTTDTYIDSTLQIPVS